MARVKSSSLIQSISGKVGGIVFVPYKGTLTVRGSPRFRDARTELQLKIRESLGFFIKSYFNLNIYERALWEEYGHNLPYKENVFSGLIKMPRGRLKGQDAYVSINQVLASCSFPPISLPPHPSVPRPSAPCTDLTHYSEHKDGEVRFKVWVPTESPYKNVAQIWVRVRSGCGLRHIAKVVEVSTVPLEVLLDKIRISKDKKIIEVSFKELKKTEFKMQFRTVSEKGVFSVPSCMYVLEVVEG